MAINTASPFRYTLPPITNSDKTLQEINATLAQYPEGVSLVVPDESFTYDDDGNYENASANVIAGIGQLLQHSEYSKKIISLHIESFRIGNPEEIVQALKVNTTLKSLSLSNLYADNFDSTRSEKIYQALKAVEINKNLCLTELTLATIPIADKGAQCIARILELNATLTTLVLEGNHITSIGAKEIAEKLNNNSTLTTLSLNENKIGDEGVKSLARLLTKKHPVLINLFLYASDISDKGAEEIASALMSNTSLAALDLGCNPNIGDAGTKQIDDALDSNKTLRTLALWDSDYIPRNILQRNAEPDLMFGNRVIGTIN